MENKDIEIVEEEKEGISIGDIFKRIWHAKITLGVTFAAVLVLGVVGIHYLYTKPNQVYSGSVTYQFRGASQGLYPNGTTFDYRNLIEPSTLQTIKNSNSEYANIDIQTMIDKNAIKVEQAVRNVYNDAGEEVPTVLPNYITLTCSASYFDSEAQAKSFLQDVLQAPNNLANSLYDAIVYNQNLELASTALTYEDQYSYLINQRDLIYSNYSELISTFGESAFISADSTKTVSQELTIIRQFFTQYNLTNLQSEARLNGYVKSKQTTEIDKLKNELDRLVHQYNLNQTKIDNLQTQWKEMLANAGSVIISSPNDFITSIHNLTATNTDLYDSIETIANKLGAQLSGGNGVTLKVTYSDEPSSTYSEAPQTYVETLATITNQLTSYTDQLKTTTTYLYTTYAEPIYTLPSVFELSGGLNIILNGAISFVAAVILACLVAGIKGSIDMKREEKNLEDLAEETGTTN